jgi:hypothetical protein
VGDCRSRLVGDRARQSLRNPRLVVRLAVPRGHCEGDVRRKLYTDGDLAVFSYRRCLILNGIDVGALRGDLTERMLPVELYRIDDADRLDEDELWQAWRTAHPRILGGPA